MHIEGNTVCSYKNCSEWQRDNSMELHELSISNFKMFEHIKLIFEPGFNLILGDNGVGKTTILEAATVALSGFLIGMEDVSARNFYKGDVHYRIFKDGNGTPNRAYSDSMEISSTLKYDGNDYPWVRAKKDVTSGGKTTIAPRDILRVSHELVNDISARMWPLISYQSAARHWVSARSDANKKKRKQLHDRRCGYLGCLDKSNNLQLIYEWCMQMEWINVRQHRIPENYKIFSSIISKFMSMMNDGIISEVIFDPNVGRLLYVENGEFKEIEDLSAGYQFVLNLVIDLAYRMAILNPDAGSNIQNAEGVVLIDEIDSNLHPKWQWRIVDALTETFPNIQFIAATHSPIIVSSCKKANIINVEAEQTVNYVKSSYAFSVNEILRDMLGYHMRPEKVERLMETFEDCMDQDKYTEAKAALVQLVDILGSDHPEAIALTSEFTMEAGD